MGMNRNDQEGKELESGAAKPEKKTGLKPWVRALALFLAVILVANIVLSAFTRVRFSSEDYTGTSQQSAAEYLESTDSYINSDFLRRNYQLLRQLGENATYSDFYSAASYAISGNNYVQAVEYLEKCTELFSGTDFDKAELYLKLGSVYCMVNRWNDARSAFNEARRANPDEPSVWLLSAEANLQLGSYASALKCMEHYETMETPTPDQYLVVAAMQMETGRYEDAIATATATLEMDGCNRLELLRVRTQANLLLGNMQAANEDAAIIAEEGEDIPELKAIRALYSETMGDYADALRLYREIIDAGNKDATVFEEAIQCAYIAEDYEAMVDISRSGLNLETEGDAVNATFLRWLGIALLLTDAYEESLEPFNEYLALNPEDAETAYFCGLGYMGAEDYDGAIKLFTDCIEAGVMKEESLYNRALCHMMNGWFSQAAKDLNQLIGITESEEMKAAAKELLKSM